MTPRRQDVPRRTAENEDAEIGQIGQIPLPVKMPARLSRPMLQEKNPEPAEKNAQRG